MSAFDQKSKRKFGLGLHFGTPKADQKTEGPKDLEDIPDVLCAVDPSAADEEVLAVLEKKDPEAAKWVRSLDLPPGALTYGDVVSWLGTYFRDGLTAEEFKKIRIEKKCPRCGRAWCAFARSSIAEIMGW